MDKIHATAVVSAKAKLAANVQVGPFAVIDENVSIGEGTVVGAHSVITGYTEIGSDCRIFSHAMVGAAPQDLKYKGEKSYLEIGDRNTIREFTTINPGTGEGGKTVIGSDNLIMVYAHIAHDCIVGDHNIIVNAGTLGGHVVVEDHCLVSAFVAVHQFVRIGRLAIIGGCSKVVQDIPPYSTSDGHPVRVYGLNKIGLRRNKYSLEAIKALDKAFNVIFNGGVPVKLAMEKLSEEKDLTMEVRYLIDFIKNSKRGIARSCRVAARDSEDIS